MNIQIDISDQSNNYILCLCFTKLIITYCSFERKNVAEEKKGKKYWFETMVELLFILSIKHY